MSVRRRGDLRVSLESSGHGLGRRGSLAVLSGSEAGPRSRGQRGYWARTWMGFGAEKVLALSNRQRALGPAALSL